MLLRRILGFDDDSDFKEDIGEATIIFKGIKERQIAINELHSIRVFGSSIEDDKFKKTFQQVMDDIDTVLDKLDSFGQAIYFKYDKNFYSGDFDALSFIITISERIISAYKNKQLTKEQFELHLNNSLSRRIKKQKYGTIMGVKFL